MKSVILLFALLSATLAYSADEKSAEVDPFNALIHQIATSKEEIGPETVTKFQKVFNESCLAGAKQKEKEIFSESKLKYNEKEKKRIWATIKGHCQCISTDSKLGKAFVALAKSTKDKDSSQKSYQDGLMKALKGAQTRCLQSQTTSDSTS
jgi:hypothetical protein